MVNESEINRLPEPEPNGEVERKIINDSEGSSNAALVSTIFYILAVAAAIFLRFYLLEIKPLHHDEGVNSFFLLNLANKGEYRYDPTNYHGPTLYYFVWLTIKILGESEFALRFYPALCGVLTVALMYPLRRGLGLIGMPVAAWSLALCPGLVYYSRDFIHESSFGFFTVGIIVTAYHWRKKYSLTLFTIFAGLLYTTKETSIHTTGVLILSVFCAVIWDVIRKSFRGEEPDFYPIRLKDLKLQQNWHYGLSLIALFIVIYIIFYTSFFTNPKGPIDFFRSVFMWTGRGVNEGIHDHIFSYYFGILLKLELPLVVAAISGLPLILWRGSRFKLFTLAWAYGMFFGYSLIPYKTPWLMVSMLIALAVFSGSVAQEIFSLLKFSLPQIAFITLLIAVAVPIARICRQVNFIHYEDNENHTSYFKNWGEKFKLRAYTDTQYGYVYAQTDKDTLNLVQEIYRLNPSDIQISSPDYWPLPWYLRSYTVSSYSQGISDNFDLPMLIANESQAEEFGKKLEGKYTSQEFTLRPGVTLVLFSKKP